jgi:hypothetical protein
LTVAGPGAPWSPGQTSVTPSRTPVLERAAKVVLVVAGVGAVLFFLLRLGSPLCACSTAPGPSPTVAIPASPIDGVVVKVDSTGIGDVRGFTMRVAGGATLDLTLGTLENAAQFAPGHLTEHAATATPVRAYFVVTGGIPVVYRLEDAPEVSSSPERLPS